MQVSMRYPMMADDRYLYTPSGDCEMQVRFLFVENTPIIEKRSEVITSTAQPRAMGW